MFPILIKNLGPVTVHTYGFMMAVGVAFALWFLFVQAKKQGLNGTKIVDMAFYTIIISLVGAKVILFPLSRRASQSGPFRRSFSRGVSGRFSFCSLVSA